MSRSLQSTVVLAALLSIAMSGTPFCGLYLHQILQVDRQPKPQDGRQCTSIVP